ncbi:GlxA family transcriptional regulator [Leucobacter sp. wl10]|uniref:GlxA family transcriptional regulator n=1 Tax=Leucobacter sp. wl10 TaxID=2304677 RepID=UPI001F09D353|nr:DJ-1/PfpI family protein [Leucobacter sp. wl10]
MFLLFDRVKHLDVAGPAEVFSEANRRGANYVLRFVSSSGAGVRTSTGLSLSVDAAASKIDHADTVVIPGGDDLPITPIAPELRESTIRLVDLAARVVSVCTGAFLLAEAGKLDGRRATTHWAYTGLLSRVHARVEVAPDAIYVSDGKFYTSAGVSAGIDLALALVELDYGADLARDVARHLVVYLQRPGGQSQFSDLLVRTRSAQDSVRTVVEQVISHPAEKHDLSSLAKCVGLSTRHLARLFQSELGLSPTKFVEQVRLDTAKALLLKGEPVYRVAQRAGFQSPETLRRVFAAQLGVPPSEYQQRFSSARRSSAIASG